MTISYTVGQVENMSGTYLLCLTMGFSEDIEIKPKTFLVVTFHTCPLSVLASPPHENQGHHGDSAFKLEMFIMRHLQPS